MTSIQTQISENLVKDLIIEFLTKTGLESTEISDLKIDWCGIRHAGSYNMTYTIKEVEVSKTNGT